MFSNLGVNITLFLLGVQESKRHRSDAFVYQRQEERAKVAENVPYSISKPIIHTSRPNTKTPAFQSPKIADSGANDESDINSVDNSTPATGIDSGSNSGTSTISEPRRFHMSRREMLLAAASQPDRAQGGVPKKRSAPTLFVERRIKRISSRPLAKLQAANNVAANTATQALAPTEDMEVDPPIPTRKLKKPGVARLAHKVDGEKYKAEIPKSLTERWNVDAEKLTAEMNSYALEQIGLNLQKVDDEKAASQHSAKAKVHAQAKYKPKQIKRYAERYPEAHGPADQDMMDTDGYISDSDDGEYIIETYERVPASKMGEHIPPQSIGVLVFDQEPDFEYFHGEGGDSDDEWAEDEEDENGK